MPHEQMIFCLGYNANCGSAVICSLLPVLSNDIFAFERTFLDISIHENLFMIIKHSWNPIMQYTKHLSFWIYLIG